MVNFINPDKIFDLIDFMLRGDQLHFHLAYMSDSFVFSGKVRYLCGTEDRLCVNRRTDSIKKDLKEIAHTPFMCKNCIEKNVALGWPENGEPLEIYIA